LWGISASDSSRGYAVWGGPPAMGHIDGSVVPCAAGGSLPFLPEATLRVLRTIYTKYQERAWRRYGFVDAFNPLTNWYSQDVLGIDTGVMMLMAENARTVLYGTFHEKRHRQKWNDARRIPHDYARDARRGCRAGSCRLSNLCNKIGERLGCESKAAAASRPCRSCHQGG